MQKIRVLMLSRSTLHSAPGGDTIQIESTAKYLRRLGACVDIHLANNKLIDYSQYDLLHLFNLIRPNDLIYHVRKSGKPFVLSTVYVDYSEFEQKVRQGFLGLTARILDKYKVEYLKVVARAIMNHERIVSSEYWFWGQKKAMRWLVKNAAFLLPNSLSEMNRIIRDLTVTNQYAIIPNAIDKEKFALQGTQDTRREGILCVGRIEGLKNQLKLIQAVQGSNIPLTVVGKVAPNHQKYFEQCRKAAGPNVFFINHVSQEELKAIYAKAKVHILPSWFETTGLSSLEAAYMGCNIVVTKKGDTEEYFGKFAFYCEPDDVDSMRKALELAYIADYSEEFNATIEKNYVWEVSAQKTLEVYRKVVS